MIAESGMEYQLSSFKFCDLAGAERTKKTGNMGDRLKEAGGINNSLLVLGRCLEAVNQNQTKDNKKHPDRVVPVRDSKLTFLLQSSLTGHEKFVMIVNLYPTADFFEENLNVLKFGSIANQIVVKKPEIRTFKRQSSRYSYLMQHSSMMNNSLRNDSM
jgi:kinesin family protein 20